MTLKLIVPCAVVLLGGVFAATYHKPEKGGPATTAPVQGSQWQAASSAASVGIWIKAESEMSAPDGVTHLCKVNVGPIVTDASGESVRPVAMFSVFLHTSGDYIGVLESARLIPATGNDPLTYGMGPFAGESPTGVEWSGVGMKMANLQPSPGKTWTTLEGSNDLQLTLFVQ
jgi:hypothetical protein